MTCWSFLIFFMATICKCAIDIVGLEYGSSNQTLSDETWMNISVIAVVSAIIVDVVNIFFRKI